MISRDRRQLVVEVTGQQSIQYRGGPPEFLKVLNDHTLALADFGGNRQYLAVGNLSENPKAFLLLMDYANQRPVKVWGTAWTVEGDAALEEKLLDPTYPGKVERVILFTVETWDVNCHGRPSSLGFFIPAMGLLEVTPAPRTNSRPA